MRIIIAALGSAGDVHPFVGIGRELARRGHDVRLHAQERFGALAASSGITLEPTLSEAESLELESHPELWHASRGALLILRDYVGRRMGKLVDALTRQIVPGETVLVGSTLALAARVVSDATGTPLAQAHLAPSNLRSIERPARMPGLRIPAWLPRGVKRRVFSVVDRIVDPALVGAYDEQRARFGLSPVRRGLFETETVSPHLTLGLFPEWFAKRPSDWPGNLALSGFPLFDESRFRSIDRETARWIEQGEAPILFTPGSAHRHARAFFSAALGALRRMGRRAIFVGAERSNLPPVLPSTVRYESYVPFGQLIPLCAAIVHHGGIGTSAQGLAAGVPQLVQGMAFDQPDNGARLETLGTGRWLPRRRFRAARVARELDALLSSSLVRTAARRCAERLRAEDGIGEAARLIERLGGSGSPAE